MNKKIRVSYLDDQESMRNGLASFFNNVDDFDVKFVDHIERLEKSILDNRSEVVIADNDLGGSQYDEEIVALVKRMEKQIQSKIILIGCTALEVAQSYGKVMIKLGYDQFFDNDGSDEELNIICNYVRSRINR